MHHLKWSGSEKKVARRAYEAALDKALAEVMDEFKEMAAAASTPSDMWDVEAYLREKRRDLDNIFDYRYSRLLFAFARLIREGYLKESDPARFVGRQTRGHSKHAFGRTDST